MAKRLALTGRYDLAGLLTPTAGTCFWGTKEIVMLPVNSIAINKVNYDC